MNTMNILYASVLLTSCAILVSIEAYSEPDCSFECDLKDCPPLPDCKCGTYKDYCGCCSFCLKCPGDECSLVAMEQCANGTSCKAPEGASAIDKINGPGRCT